MSVVSFPTLMASIGSYGSFWWLTMVARKRPKYQIRITASPESILPLHHHKKSKFIGQTALAQGLFINL